MHAPSPIDPDGPAPRSPWLDRGLWVASALVTGLALLTCVLPALPLGVDLPTHAAMGALLAHPPADDVGLVTSWTPTAQLFVRLVQPFAWVLSPTDAARAALVVTLAVACTGGWRLARVLGTSAPLAVAGAASASVGFCFAMGFSNFLLACGLALHALASAVRGLERGDPRSLALAAALGLLVVHAHTIVAAMYLCQLGALALLPPRTSDALDLAGIARRSMRAAILGLPAAAATTLLTLAVRDTENTSRAGAGTLRLGLVEALERAGEMSFGGLAGTGWLALGGLVAALALDVWRRTPGDRRGTALALVPWCVAWFAIPFHLPGWAYAQPRTLVFAAFVAPALMGVSRYATVATGSSPGRILAPWLLLAALGAHGATTLAAAVALGDEGRDWARSIGVDADGRGPAPGRITTLRLDVGAPDGAAWVTPWLHLDAWLAAQGGRVPDWQAGNRWMHSVRHADVGGMPSADEGLPMYLWRAVADTAPEGRDAVRAALADRAAWAARDHDRIVVIGCAPADMERLMLRGGVPVAACAVTPRSHPVAVVVEGLDAPAWLDLVLHWPETIGPLTGARAYVEPGVAVPVARLPAGPAMLEVRSMDEVLVRVPVLVDDGPATVRVILPPRATPRR